MLESINLFPETKFLRSNNDVEMDHKCGGLSSLGILFALVTVLLFKLHEVFKMETVFFSKQTIVDQEPLMTNISTSLSNPIQSPFMMAFYLWNRRCPSVTFDISAKIYNSQNNNNQNVQVTYTEFPLERCTKQHFINIPQLKTDKNQSNNFKQWYCFPLNMSLEIGGHFQISNTFKAIQVYVNCSNTCEINSCGTGLIYLVNSLINPNNQQPFEYFLRRHQMDLTKTTFKAYAIRVNENVVITDQSLLPTEKKSTKRSYSTQQIQYRASIDKRSQSFSLLWVERSPFTTVVQRRYLKLLDVASYVGGIFPTLFSLFFFMKFFGIYFFNMSFAFQHFKEGSSRKILFPHFIKHSAYKFLKKLGCEPKNWSIPKKEYTMAKTINKILDINYLFKRIQFLQCAISCLLDEHQLKGIYLSKVTLQTAENKYKKHKIRDRVMHFLNKNINQKEKYESKKIHIDQLLESRTKPLTASKRKQHQLQIIPEQQLESSKNLKNQFTFDRSKLKRKEQMVISKNINYQAELMNDNEDQPLRKQENIYFLKNQINKTDIICQDDFDQPNLKEEIRNDFSRLFKEAKYAKNPVSTKIVENLQEWLKSEMKSVIKELQQQENPMQQLYYDLNVNFRHN